MPFNELGEVERVLADLYTYRYVLTAVGALAGAGVAYVLVRQGLLRLVGSHRLVSASLGLPLLVVCVLLGNYLLSPLWERSHLVEESPLAMTVQMSRVPESQTGAEGQSREQSFQPRVTHTGTFKGSDDFHFGRGDASFIASAPGQTVVRFEDFSVRNGPDLYVYLSRDNNVQRVDESLNLGRLKATDGAFNYELPASVDLSGVKSVVIWCKQFGVLFAEAPLRDA